MLNLADTFKYLLLCFRVVNFGEMPLNPAEKIWWLKVVLAIAVAFLTLLTQVYFDLSGLTSFSLGIIMYIALSDVLSSMNNIDRFRGLKVGVGAYFLTWLTAWILLHTFFITSY